MSKGLERARQFSWDKTARETMEVYESVEQFVSTRSAWNDVQIRLQELRAALREG